MPHTLRASRRGTGLWTVLAVACLAIMALAGYGSHHRGDVAMKSMVREHRLRIMHSAALSAVAEAGLDVLAEANDPTGTLYGCFRTIDAPLPPFRITPTAARELFGAPPAGVPSVAVGDVAVDMSPLAQGAGSAWGGEVVSKVTVECLGVMRTFVHSGAYYLTAVPGGAYPAEVRLSRSAVVCLEAKGSTK